MTQEIVIVAAARTAVGKFGGTLAKTSAPELGAVVLKALLERSGLSSEQIGEVILGQVLQAGSGGVLQRHSGHDHQQGLWLWPEGGDAGCTEHS
jgi:acetyl-CoA acetyltransferase